MDTVKFRKEVPEEIRKNVREFMRGKVFYEADTGMVAPMSGLFQYLFDEGYHTRFHDYGMEVIPLADWVKGEIAEYPDQHSRDILRKHLVEHGVPEEKVNEMMEDKQCR